MKNKYILLLLLFCQVYSFAQDKNVTKIAEYIKDKKDIKAKELLDKLDKKSEYQSDVSFWFVRTAYYRNFVIENPNKTKELAEARKSFEKLEELDKNDPLKLYSKYIPQLRKGLYEGENQLNKSGSNSKSSSVNQANDNGKTVTLLVTGEGLSKDAAKYNAFRNAIEKAFGAFISSEKTILDDELKREEIVSVSSGNIQDFEILSETKMPDGSYSNLVKATVSIGKLTKYCESKGISVEFKGSLFAANIKLEQLKEANINSVIENMCYVVNKLIEKGCFDYKIEVKEPEKDFNIWRVNMVVRATANENLKNIRDLIQKTYDGVESFSGPYENYYKSIFMYNIPLSSLNFQVNDGIKNYESISLLEQDYRGYYGHFNNVATKDQGTIVSKNSVLSIGNNSNKEYLTDNSCKLLELIHSQTDLQRIKTKNFDYAFKDPYQAYGNNIGIYLYNLEKINFDFYFSIPYSLEVLSKVTEFKVSPIK